MPTPLARVMAFLVANEERAARSPTCPSGIATAMPVGTSVTTPGGDVCGLGCGEVEARVGRVCAGRDFRVGVREAGGQGVHVLSLGCCAPFWGGFVALVAVRGLDGVCGR